MKIALLLIGAVFVGFAAWVRLAPTQSQDWHIDPQVTDNQDLEGGVKRRVSGDQTTLQALDSLARATPRTELLAGSLQEGHLTYVTRSKLMGFPDYASVLLRDGHIEIYSRLRFGKSDLGVNKARVDGWLSQL